MSVAINNVQYYCYNNSHAIAITSNNPPSQWDLVVPKKISFSAVNHDVTHIAQNAFNSCRQLQSLVISDNITNIGEAAFSFCPNLKSVIIGSGVTYIGNLCFYGCSNLETIVFMNFNKLTHLGNFVFHGLSKKCIVEIRDIENVDSNVDFEKKINNMFKNEKNITIKFINSTYHLSDNDNDAKEDIVETKEDMVETKEDMVETKEDMIETKEDMVETKEVMIETKEVMIETKKMIVEPIKSYNNKNQEDITIINETMFVKNNVLYSIKENNLSIIGCSNPSSDWHLQIPQNITISKNKYTVTSIENDAFKNRLELKSIVIPNSITCIGKRSFQGCINLHGKDDIFVIPDSITEIGDDAFNNCKKLNSLRIGAKVTNLGDRCFYNIPFNSIYFRSPCAMKAIGKNIFSKEKFSSSTMNVTYYFINSSGDLNKIMKLLHFTYFSNANIIYSK